MSDKPDNIKQFTKQKKSIPGELSELVFHNCIGEHTSLKWMIQFNSGVLEAICSDCGDRYDFRDFLKLAD
jgi:hypothetical protein